ncbi:hypothetical protein LUZ61_020572 [Rhynchospora tenuis]|uniref:Uncharacterized protein n=1 Tax=Rhynchospora tenuis TaxID=198213 RepID=A0AAD5ZD93_9POAL|nr:hypothetical protein LUZ61_020572 [Rhynchospora tenuis]
MAASLARKLQNVKLNPTLSSVYRVDETRLRREGLEEEFTPTKIGIGVFHGDLVSKYQPLKLACFKRFVDRSEKPIDYYWDRLKEIEISIRNFYSPLPKDIDSDELIESMLIDGSFLIELFRGYNDPHNYVIPYHYFGLVRNDLLKVENQIPFPILELLFQLQEGCSTDSRIELVNLCVLYFRARIPTTLKGNFEIHDHKHVLHLYHQIFTADSFIQISSLPFTLLELLESPQPMTIPSATQLKHHGIQFQTSSKSNTMCVEFKYGTLTLPVIDMNGFNRAVIANLVAYEEMDEPLTQPVTHLCSLLNSLMPSESDAALLCKKGIVVNALGNETDVVQFFTNLCANLDTNLEEGYLCPIVYKVNKHYNSKFRKWAAKAKRDLSSQLLTDRISTATERLQSLLQGVLPIPH